MTNSNGMKLLVIVVNDAESENLQKALLEEDYRVTRIASTGGFLRRGSSTFLIGIEAEKVEKAMRLVREHCAPSVDPSLKKVTIFVLKVDQFEQL
jgi:uncharacterized protein YaaQ